MHKSLHIVSFDIPYPADYGGVIDVYYRIKALHKLGVKIHLHCFEYGRNRQKALDALTEKVHYYPRERKLSDAFAKKPFIVSSRSKDELLKNLLLNDFPILFEGLHTCNYLDHPSLRNRIKLVRTHNIEHEYYMGLALSSTGIKSIHFKREAKKLERFEQILIHANHILAIKENDRKYFSKYCGSCINFPASSSNTFNQHQTNTEPYVLFQGNLSVEENHKAAIWLCEKVFAHTDQKCIIAGKNPRKELLKEAEKSKVQLIVNPTQEHMNQLITQARIHSLYTDQSTGVKLKLINALNSSGHIIANSKMVTKELQAYCHTVLRPEDYSEAIENKIKNELDEYRYVERQNFLKKNFSTLENCKKLLELL